MNIYRIQAEHVVFFKRARDKEGLYSTKSTENFAQHCAAIARQEAITEAKNIVVVAAMREGLPPEFVELLHELVHDINALREEKK